MKNLRWRAVVVIFTVLFSVWLLIPTALRYGGGMKISRTVQPEDPWWYRVIPSEVLKLGLDLRGGVHIVLGINYPEVRTNAVAKMAKQMKELAEDEKIEGLNIETGKDGGQDVIIVKYPTEASWEKVEEKILGPYFGDRLNPRNQTEAMAMLEMIPTYQLTVDERARAQSLETIRNRIDEFGLAEPTIQPHGEDKILVQFPGIGEEEVDRIKAIISRTAKLSFQIVRTGLEKPRGEDGPKDQGNAPDLETLTQMVEDFKKAKNIEITETNPISTHLDEINKWLAENKKVPAATELVFHRQVDVNTRETEYIPYLLNKEHILDGEQLEDAYQGYDPQTNDPIVNFSLNTLGATQFERGTRENVNRSMAIVLDRNVHSAPNIEGPIPGGRARITMGRRGSGGGIRDVMSEAKDTALVLRSGALPARLEFLEERTIGPSLGADAIRAGTSSLAIGLAAVLVFMAIYYRAAGILAVVALILNALFVLGAMAAFEGTLTLPGLAGLTLTLGMAVDANVLIFEHIREELRLGKSVNMAIAEGYRRAFSAILDSNLTTMSAALVLMSFGYGPIQGFAVTLLIGLVASMYTAVFVTRLIMDWRIVASGRTTLSI